MSTKISDKLLLTIGIKDEIGEILSTILGREITEPFSQYPDLIRSCGYYVPPEPSQ